MSNKPDNPTPSQPYNEDQLHQELIPLFCDKGRYTHEEFEDAWKNGYFTISKLLDSAGLYYSSEPLDSDAWSTALDLPHNPQLLLPAITAWVLIKKDCFKQPNNWEKNAALSLEIYLYSLKPDHVGPLLDGCEAIFERLKISGKKEKKTVRMVAGTHRTHPSSDANRIIYDMQRLKGEIEELEKENEEKDRQIKMLNTRVEKLSGSCIDLIKENAEIKKQMQSPEYTNKIGKEYTTRLFSEFLTEADEWDQGIRSKYHDVLQGFLPVDGFPPEIKNVIKALIKKPKTASNPDTTVNVQPGATVIKYDIHDNNKVDTK